MQQAEKPGNNNTPFVSSWRHTLSIQFATLNKQYGHQHSIRLIRRVVSIWIAMIAANVARSLLSNPQVRAMARQGAKQGGLWALGKMNQRRKGRGKKVFLPVSTFTGGSTRTASSRSTRMNVPVRTNVSTTTRTQDLRCVDSEVSDYPVLGHAGMDGGATSIWIDPGDTTLYPKLAAKSFNYTTYDMRFISFKYSPVAGSQNNGTMAVGFTPISVNKNTGYTEIDEILAMPRHETFSISSPYTFRVGASDMSQMGKQLFTYGTSPPGELTRYIAGTWSFGAYDCNITTDIGTWTVSYDVTLKSSHLYNEPNATVINCHDANNEWTISTFGSFRPRLEDDGTTTSVTIASRKPTSIAVIHQFGAAPLHRGDTTLTPDRSFVNAEFGVTIDFYHIGRMRGPQVFSVPTGLPKRLTVLEMNESFTDY